MRAPLLPLCPSRTDRLSTLVSSSVGASLKRDWLRIRPSGPTRYVSPLSPIPAVKRIIAFSGFAGNLHGEDANDLAVLFDGVSGEGSRSVAARG